MRPFLRPGTKREGVWHGVGCDRLARFSITCDLRGAQGMCLFQHVKGNRWLHEGHSSSDQPLSIQVLLSPSARMHNSVLRTEYNLCIEVSFDIMACYSTI